MPGRHDFTRHLEAKQPELANGAIDDFLIKARSLRARAGEESHELNVHCHDLAFILGSVADLCANFGRYAEAIELCEFALHLESHLPTKYFRRGTPLRFTVTQTLVNSLLALGRKEDAKRAIDAARDRIEYAITAHADNHPVRRNHPDWLYNFVYLYERLGCLEEAQACRNRMHEIGPERFDSALKELSWPSTRNFPGDIMRLQQQQRYSEAAAAARGIIGFWEVVRGLQMGSGLEDSRHYLDFSKHARVDLLWSAYLESRQVAENDGQRQQSAKLLNTASQEPLLALRDVFITPEEEATIQNELAWKLLTWPDAKMRDAELAQKLATSAVERSPDNAMPWNTLGLAEYRCGRFAEAETALLKSIDKGPGKQGLPEDWFVLAMSQLLSYNRKSWIRR